MKPLSTRLTTAAADLSNSVYEAAIRHFEGHEFAGRWQGSGHHAAQAIAQAAVEKLERRWRDDAAEAAKEE